MSKFARDKEILSWILVSMIYRNMLKSWREMSLELRQVIISMVWQVKKRGLLRIVWGKVGFFLKKIEKVKKKFFCLYVGWDWCYAVFCGCTFGFYYVSVFDYFNG